MRIRAKVERMRKIPATMATQHPDNACAPYWSGNPFITTGEEIEEAHRCFAEMGIEEYMWDWEGKFVDEAVIDRLFRKYREFFLEHQIGRDIFLTYRVPNIWQESGYRLMRPFMNILSIAEFAREFGYTHPPVFEIILPMTQTSDQMAFLKKKFHMLADMMPKMMEEKIKNQTFHIDIIPLFESVDDMIESARVLKEYASWLNEFTGERPSYMRVFIARSDPAENAGLISAVISAKAAISEYKKFEKETGIHIYPFLGCGSLPFRGGLAPDTVNNIIQEYKGLSTVTVQSSFRYDHPKNIVEKAVALLNSELPKYHNQYTCFSAKDLETVRAINRLIVPLYQKTIEKISDIINAIATHVPSRRERMLHLGLFGYSRGIGAVKLPRAITFTASLYSLGIPPELIGAGRAIKLLRREKLLSFVEERYVNFRNDLNFAYRFLNKENLDDLARAKSAFRAIREDVSEVERYIKKDMCQMETDHFLHRNETSSVYQLLKNNRNFSEPLLNAARIRKSLG